MSERRARAMIVLIPVLLVAFSIWFTVHRTDVDEHKWCDIINAAVVGPAPKRPSHNNAKEERSYQFYQRFIILQHSLGCK